MNYEDQLKQLKVDINKAKDMKNRSEIALESLKNEREELLNELDSMGIEPENLETEIKNLEIEIEKLFNEAESNLPKDLLNKGNNNG